MTKSKEKTSTLKNNESTNQKKLVEVEPISNTPFAIVKDKKGEKKDLLVLGQNIVKESPNQTTINKLKEIDWEIVFNVLEIYISNRYKLINNK